ncbi:hypothetical protein V6N11_065035 [Hibiscus sabdariffa]|uniref:RNase H type-1 domain-containing protein n=1 Tax=Hibiscus sabdariffa TaxID=183260 RepID=A0ABR2SIV1_9ROSI
MVKEAWSRDQKSSQFFRSGRKISHTRTKLGKLSKKKFEASWKTCDELKANILELESPVDFQIKGKACVAAVIRDDHGQLIGIYSKQLPTSLVPIAEASAIRVDIIAAIETNYSHVIVKSYTHGVINHINFKMFSA